MRPIIGCQYAGEVDSLILSPAPPAAQRHVLVILCRRAVIHEAACPRRRRLRDGATSAAT